MDKLNIINEFNRQTNEMKNQLASIFKGKKSIEYVLPNNDCIEDDNYNYWNRQRPQPASDQIAYFQLTIFSYTCQMKHL